MIIPFDIPCHNNNHEKKWSFRALICGFPQGEQIGTLKV